jgi:chromosome segregation ATPase
MPSRLSSVDSPSIEQPYPLLPYSLSLGKKEPARDFSISRDEDPAELARIRLQLTNHEAQERRSRYESLQQTLADGQAAHALSLAEKAELETAIGDARDAYFTSVHELHSHSASPSPAEERPWQLTSHHEADTKELKQISARLVALEKKLKPFCDDVYDLTHDLEQPKLPIGQWMRRALHRKTGAPPLPGSVDDLLAQWKAADERREFLEASLAKSQSN